MPCFLQVCFQSFCSVALFAVVLALGPFGRYAINVVKRVTLGFIKPSPSTTKIHVSPKEDHQGQEKAEDCVVTSHLPSQNTEAKQLLAQLAIMEEQLKITKQQALLLAEKETSKTEPLLVIANEWDNLKQNHKVDPLKAWNRSLNYEISIPAADHSSDSDDNEDNEPSVSGPALHPVAASNE